MKRKRDRRFSVNLPLLKEVRLSLFGHAYNESKTGMAERIIIEKVSGTCDWGEIQKELRQEAALLGIPVEQLIREVLEADGYGTIIDLDGVDLTVLLDDEESGEYEDEYEE